jgi:hypothetical protein
VLWGLGVSYPYRPLNFSLFFNTFVFAKSVNRASTRKETYIRLRGWQKVIINTPSGTVEGIAPVIISASRATDISDFYPDWIMHRLRRGYVKWINRFNS